MENLSNELQVTPQTPPTFLFHTDEDKGVPAENSILFYLALRKAGVPAEMHIFEQGTDMGCRLGARRIPASVDVAQRYWRTGPRAGIVSDRICARRSEDAIPPQVRPGGQLDGRAIHESLAIVIRPLQRVGPVGIGSLPDNELLDH